MSEQFEMVAKTFQGLENVLADELKALGAVDVETGKRVVAFKGDKATMYRANFCCRTALRILKPIYKFNADNIESLYESAKKFDWEKIADAAFHDKKADSRLILPCIATSSVTQSLLLTE